MVSTEDSTQQQDCYAKIDELIMYHMFHSSTLFTSTKKR